MKSILLLLFLCWSSSGLGQTKKLVLTLDDMPFNATYRLKGKEDLNRLNRKLLSAITYSQQPITAFITGKGIDSDKDFQLLKEWLEHPLVTVGSHTVHHLNHSSSSKASFIEEVSANHSLIMRVMPENKALDWFRFPYNAMGVDKSDQDGKAEILHTLGYRIAPFTFESVDYAYNALYEDALINHDSVRAREIVQDFFSHTLRSLHFADSLAQQHFGRPIPQIYLGHANPLHADFYQEFIALFHQQDYEIISLNEAMEDPAYSTPLHYHGKWGFSWLFRWIEDPNLRRKNLQAAPDLSPAYLKAYNALLDKP